MQERQKRYGSNTGLGRSPGGQYGNPPQYSCLENLHGQRSLEGYSPWGLKELEMTQTTEHARMYRQTITHKAPLCMGLPRQEQWSGLPFPSPRDLSDPGIKPMSPSLEGVLFLFVCLSFYHWATSVPFSCSVMSNSLWPHGLQRQASLFIINSWNLFKLMSIESVMPSNHLILCHRLVPPLSIIQYQGLFTWVSSSHQVAKVSEFQLQHQSFQWIFRTDFL